MNIRTSSTILACSLHRLKSVLAKPVVVMIDSTWNSAVRTAASSPALMPSANHQQHGRDRTMPA